MGIGWWVLDVCVDNVDGAWMGQIRTSLSDMRICTGFFSLGERGLERGKLAVPRCAGGWVAG